MDYVLKTLSDPVVNFKYRREFYIISGTLVGLQLQNIATPILNADFERRAGDEER